MIIRKSRSLVSTAILLLFGSVPVVFGDPAPSRADVTEKPIRWATEYHSGILWRFTGSATPLSYTVLPQILSVLCPPSRVASCAGGTLVLRSRLSLLIEPIIRGPEHRYIGTCAAGDLEWRHPAGRLNLFFAGGGGFGFMDSKGHEVQGGQGQDLNLNWLLHVGARYRTKERWRVSAGVYFQHISNRNMDKVNPGLNAIGPTLGIARDF